MIKGGAIGWSNTLVIAGFGVFVVAAAVFLALEAWKSGPMLPLPFFRNWTFTAARVVGLLINLAFYGLIFMFSLYFQQTKNLTPLTTGLAFMPMTAAVVAANVAAGHASAWLRARAGRWSWAKPSLRPVVFSWCQPALTQSTVTSGGRQS
jgi:DHA2 family methylenomycin A resistance protein-like MFS transporter